jgi:uncharacterized membrane protein YhaH (DUF805 family)
MGLSDIHSIFFNAHILFSVVLGAWSVGIAVQNRSISGNFWGALATITILAAVIALLGIVMALSGLQPESGRSLIYFLYMSWLVVIMPGLFTLLRGGDDRRAAMAFALLSFFNAATSFSMLQRGLAGPWVPFPA